MGLNTYSVPMSMFATNRGAMEANLRKAGVQEGVVLLKGGEATNRYDTDHENLFRQESYFHYLFGVKEPGFFGAVTLKAGGGVTATLYCPRLPAEYAVWMGKILTPSDFVAIYGVDECLYVDEMEATISGSITDANKLYLMTGKNSDSGSTYPLPELGPALAAVCTDTTTLFPALQSARVYKSPAELDLMAHASKLSSLAHVYTMRECKPGMKEYQLESLFNHYSYYNFGCRVAGYTGICACGPNPAVLHYGHAGAPNDGDVAEGDMLMLDMGSEYCCYGADISCSFPANGKFTDAQAAIYTAVLNAQVAVYDMLKPGCDWMECHKAAEGEVLKGLIGLGIVVPGDKTVKELVDMRLAGHFMPHGLGHFIGIDTHDVGGYADGQPARSTQLGLKSLRTSRLMEENMCLTVEPGCYFIDHMINLLLADEKLSVYIDSEKLTAMRGTGGVRLEDVIAITATGCVNFTMAPRGVDEVEAVMGGGKWPPMKDAHPECRREGMLNM
jgi:Xaa-Pro dipeptidase